MYEHNYRLGECDNADPDRKNENEELLAFPEGIGNYKDFYENKVATCEFYKTHKLRKDGVRALDIQMSHGDSKDGRPFNEKEWIKQSIKYLEDTFGKENIGSAVLHKDEKVSHIHAFVVPASHEKGISLTQFFAHRGDFMAQIDKYYDYIKDAGIDRPIKDTKLSHTRIKEFWTNALGEERKEISPMNPGESPEDYRNRIQKELNAERDRITHSEMEHEQSLKRIRTLEEASRRQEERHIKELAKAKERIAYLEKQLGEAKDRLEDVKAKSYTKGAREGMKELLNELGCKNITEAKRDIDSSRRLMAACEYVGEERSEKLVTEMQTVIEAYESRDVEQSKDDVSETREDR